MKMNGKKASTWKRKKTDVLHSPCTKMIVRNYILLVHKPGRKMFSHLLVLCILYCYLLTMNCSTFSTLKDLSHFITWKSYGQEQHKRNFSKLSHLKVAWREQGNLTESNQFKTTFWISVWSIWFFSWKNIRFAYWTRMLQIFSFESKLDNKILGDQSSMNFITNTPESQLKLDS